jgi:hypothetical protein
MCVCAGMYKMLWLSNKWIEEKLVNVPKIKNNFISLILSRGRSILKRGVMWSLNYEGGVAETIYKSCDVC